MNSVAPFLVFYAGAAVAGATRGVLRSAVMIAVPLIGAANLLAMSGDFRVTATLFDYTLTLTSVDRLSTLFGYLFHLAALLAIVFSLHVKDTTQHVSGLLYAGSAVGAVYAGDLITLFLFWEMLEIGRAHV